MGNVYEFTKSVISALNVFVFIQREMINNFHSNYFLILKFIMTDVAVLAIRDVLNMNHFIDRIYPKTNICSCLYCIFCQ